MALFSRAPHLRASIHSAESHVISLQDVVTPGRTTREVELEFCREVRIDQRRVADDADEASVAVHAVVVHVDGGRVWGREGRGVWD